MYFLRKTSAGHAHCKISRAAAPADRHACTVQGFACERTAGWGARRFAVRDQDHGAERPPMVPRLEPLGWRVVIAELAGTHERSFCAGAGDVPSCFIGALERLRPVLQSLSRGTSVLQSLARGTPVFQSLARGLMNISRSLVTETRKL